MVVSLSQSLAVMLVFVSRHGHLPRQSCYLSNRYRSNVGLLISVFALVLRQSSIVSTGIFMLSAIGGGPVRGFRPAPGLAPPHFDFGFCVIKLANGNELLCAYSFAGKY